MIFGYGDARQKEGIITQNMMSRKNFAFAFFAVALAGIAALAVFSPGTEPKIDFAQSAVPLPQNFPDGFVQYARVDRKDGTIRDLYINQESLEALRQQGLFGIPNQTILFIDGYYAARDEAGELLFDEAGHLMKGEPFEAIHLSEKRTDWRAEDFPGGVRSGNWNFGSFDAQSGANFSESINACFNCHNTTIETDFAYSAPDLLRFVRTGEVQYRWCELSGRTPCV